MSVDFLSVSKKSTTTHSPRKMSQGIKVLIVDDHADLVANAFAYLEPRGFVMDAAHDGIAGLQLCLDNHYDALVLDWALPRLDGLEVLSRLRASGSDIPVLMLTAKTELSNKLSGFEAGTDDYLTKPFMLAELEARIIALHTRRHGRSSTILEVGDLRYNLLTHEATQAGVPLRLHSGGKKLLELLMKESPHIVTKEKLETLLWGNDLPDKDLLRTHIYSLRKCVDGEHPVKLIQTVTKMGYRLVAEETR